MNKLAILAFVGALLSCAAALDYFAIESFQDAQCNTESAAAVFILSNCYSDQLGNHYMYSSFNSSAVQQSVCFDSACQNCKGGAYFDLGQCTAFGTMATSYNVSYGSFPSSAAGMSVVVSYSGSTCTDNIPDVVSIAISYRACTPMPPTCMTATGKAVELWCGIPKFLQ